MIEGVEFSTVQNSKFILLQKYLTLFLKHNIFLNYYT
jgi:hypothetical protein